MPRKEEGPFGQFDATTLIAERSQELADFADPYGYDAIAHMLALAAMAARDAKRTMRQSMY